MRLFQFTLPVHTNAGLSYELARKRFSREAVKLAGGITEPETLHRGVWQGEGRTYRELVAVYQVACDQETADKLLAVAWDAFPDQEALFVADLGPAVIHTRPAAAVAA
jgi:hypothetical protein